MLKAALQILAWLLAVAGLYLMLFALELDWNVFDWKPGFDLLVLGTIYGVIGMLTGIWFLSRIKSGRVVKMLTLAICLVPVVMALYLLPPEPLKPGLLGRDHHSPSWYRGGRLFVLSLPFVFWAQSLLRRGKGSDPHDGKNDRA